MIRTSMMAIALGLVLSWPLLAQTPTPQKAEGGGVGYQPAPGEGVKHADADVTKVNSMKGHRLSKLIGASVVNEADYPVASINDILITPHAKFAILAIGQTLGFGGRLVAVPFQSLTFMNGKIVLPGISQEALAKMPDFKYE